MKAGSFLFQGKPKPILLAWLALFALVFGWPMVVLASDPAGSRSILVTLKKSEQPGAAAGRTVRLYGQSHALIIGIDDYSKGWPRLSNARADAEKVAQKFREKGFSVTLEMDPDSTKLKDALERFFVVQGANPDARLFVWFAGHGHTMGGEGFLVPADAPRPSDETGFRLSALSMRRLGEYVRQARAKHVLAVFDSCFSGTVFHTSRSLPPAAVTRATTRPVRQFLSAGDADQTVSDDGAFQKLFIQALSPDSPADANADGYVTGSELGLFLTDRVTNLTASAQTPRYGKLRDPAWDQGDFVFVVGPGADTGLEKQKQQMQAAADKESLFWQAISDSRDPKDYQAYLTRFPKGVFAPLAQVRLEKYSQKKPEKQVSTKVSAAKNGWPRVIPPKKPYKPLDPATYYIAKTNVNMRDENLLRGEVMGTLEKGMWISRFGDVWNSQGHDWVHTLITRRPFCYVSEKFLKKVPPEPPFSQEAEFAVGSVFQDCQDCPKMAVIPAGSVLVGSHRLVGDFREPGEHFVHRVTIKRPLGVGETEVTRKQFAAFLKDSGYDPSGGNFHPPCKSWDRTGITQDGNHPVVCASNDDAVAYCRWLSKKTGRNYRLPSEGEWEYAARSQSERDLHWGSKPENICKYANLYDQTRKNRSKGSHPCFPCRDGYVDTAPVGSLKPNWFGLYDTIGNVEEWTADCWTRDWDQVAPADGSAMSSGDCRGRIYRGYSYAEYGKPLRVSSRMQFDKDFKTNDTGFRVVCDLD